MKTFAILSLALSLPAVWALPAPTILDRNVIAKRVALPEPGLGSDPTPPGALKRDDGPSGPLGLTIDNNNNKRDFSYPEDLEERDFSYPEDLHERDFSYPEDLHERDFSYPEDLHERDFSYPEDLEDV